MAGAIYKEKPWIPLLPNSAHLKLLMQRSVAGTQRPHRTFQLLRARRHTLPRYLRVSGSDPRRSWLTPSEADSNYNQIRRDILCAPFGVQVTENNYAAFR